MGLQPRNQFPGAISSAFKGRVIALLTESHCPHVPSTAGLLLLDVRSRIVYQNPEALRILTYPEAAGAGLPVSLPPTLQGMLDQRRIASLATEFKSGRRRYV